MEKHHVDSSRIDNVRDIEKKKEPSENAGGSISMLNRIREPQHSLASPNMLHSYQEVGKSHSCHSFSTLSLLSPPLGPWGGGVGPKEEKEGKA